MQFSEKLNFLMDVTKTTNSALSLYVALDASYISRLRSGKRLLPRNEESVQGMAEYFARNCREEYQKKALGDALGLSPFPKEVTALAKVIAIWLLAEKDEGGESVGRFLGSLFAMKGVTPKIVSHQSETAFPLDETAIYYGVEGKRRAVLYYLSEMITLDKPQTLLLFSDEETSWMTDDPVFARQWIALTMQALARGHRIKVIHTISRDLDEMLSALGQWIPLYMAGTIEPYFYPKKRDGVFRRTLFITPGVAAVVSSSVGGQTARAANVLFRNPAAVAAHEEEFMQYLRLCRPLMRIFKAKDREAALSTLAEFEKERSNVLLNVESLSLLTMPETLIAKILERTGLESAGFPDYHRIRLEHFRQSVSAHTFTEIIVLPEPRAVIEGQVKVSLSDMLEGGAVYYAPEEYLLHLQNIVKLLDTYENYHVCLVDGPLEDRYTICVKEDLGVIVAKTSPPPIMLAMNEGNMTSAFWDFLRALIGARACDNPDNKNVVSRLSEYIGQLEQMKGTI